MTRYLDHDGAEPLLESRQALIQSLLDGQSIEIPVEPELQLSPILLEIGVLVAYMTGKKVLLLTHCVYWAQQVEQMADGTRRRLCSKYGEKQVDMTVRAPMDAHYSSKLADIILMHGINHLDFVADQVVARQDLGNRWDGVIRTSAGHWYGIMD